MFTGWIGALKSEHTLPLGYAFLPDHIHMIWTLPEGDANFSTRWRLIKGKFAREFPTDFLDIPMSQSKITRGESPTWQRRFWEHTICDEDDLNNHLNYTHYNPVKHGYVDDPILWELSSYAKFFERGESLGNWDQEAEMTMPDDDV